MRRIIMVTLLAAALAVVVGEGARGQTHAPADAASGTSADAADPNAPASANPPDALSTDADARADPSAPADEADPSASVPVPEPTEKAVRYYQGNIALWIFGIIWGMAVPAGFLFTGLSARIRTIAQGKGRGFFLTVSLYGIIFTLLAFLLDLPLNFYRGYIREHAYGLSNQTLGKWTNDTITALVLSLVFTVLLLWIPYLLLRKSPRRWWFYSWLAILPLIFVLILIWPVWIDPLFNDFGPMKDKALEARILDLANRAGIEGGRVFEVEKSVDTKTINAYVTGFMATKRIVLWDTIIAKLTPDELLFVMGHEMGHYVLGHVWKTVLFLSLFLLALLYLAHRLSGALIHRFQHRFGFDRLSDVASLPLILLLASIFFFLTSPILAGWSRWQEHEADRFGLEVTQKSRPAALAFVKLLTEDLGVPHPHPLIVIWRSTHPPLGERIDFCNTYRPWEQGEPLKYERYFRRPAVAGRTPSRAE